MWHVYDCGGVRVNMPICVCMYVMGECMHRVCVYMYVYVCVCGACVHVTSGC